MGTCAAEWEQAAGKQFGDQFCGLNDYERASQKSLESGKVGAALPSLFPRRQSSGSWNLEGHCSEMSECHPLRQFRTGRFPQKSMRCSLAGCSSMAARHLAPSNHRLTAAPAELFPVLPLQAKLLEGIKALVARFTDAVQADTATGVDEMRQRTTAAHAAAHERAARLRAAAGATGEQLQVSTCAHLTLPVELD